MDRSGGIEISSKEAKDKERKRKTVMASHPDGTPPPLKQVNWCRELPNYIVADAGSGTKVWETVGNGVPVNNGAGAVWDGTWGSVRTISTYPVLPTGQRDGDPNADHAWMQLYPHRAIVALADGCNWGQRPREAARSAVDALQKYLIERHLQIPDLHEAAHYLLRAFAEADRKIMEGKEDTWEAGTTTLIAGMLLQFKDDPLVSGSPDGSSNGMRKSKEKDEENGSESEGEGDRKGKGKRTSKARRSNNCDDIRWGFVCCSVGDCKAYLYSSESGAVIDITAGNRINVTDVRDPGGRLGPYLEGGAPDLRNLKLYFINCGPGDVIMLLSDGVHDNLDPQTLGKGPSELGLPQGPNQNEWSEKRIHAPEIEQAKEIYRAKLLKELIEAGPITPKAIAHRLIDHCFTVTRACREYMEENPMARQPTDYQCYPGKMDHTTAAVLLIPDTARFSRDKESN